MSPTYTLRDLRDHEQRLSQATHDLQQALDARERELDSRRTWFARLVDVVSDTAMEARLEKAAIQMERVQNDAHIATVAWLEEQEMAWLADPASQPARDLRAILDHHRAREQRLSGLSDKAATTMRALVTAADSCSSAHAMEMVDMVSSNKGLSLMSHLETSGAADAVDAARSKLQELGTALKQSSSGETLVGVPSDLPDLAVDLIFDGGLDVLSFFNTFALSESEESCRNAIDKLNPLAQRLVQMKEQATKASARALENYDQLRTPMRVAWLQQLPETLVSLVPRDVLSPGVIRELASAILARRQGLHRHSPRPSTGPGM